MLASSEIIQRLVLAAILGGVIGIERERREWAAGLRTHMLVCLGAALAVIVSAYGFADILQQDSVILDPSRIAAQVVSGIGFLGAGTILFLQREQVIRGLTTAAGLWAVASIGLAVGSGMYLASIGATVVASLIMAGLRPFERHFFNHRNAPARMHVKINDDARLSAILAKVNTQHIPVRETVLLQDDDGMTRLELLFGLGVRDEDLTELADLLRDLPGLESVSYGSVSPLSRAHT